MLSSIIRGYDGMQQYASFFHSFPRSGALFSIAYGNNMFVTAGYTNTTPSNPLIYYSPDCINWTRVNLPKIGFIYNVEFHNGTFIAVGTDQLYTSTDGINWSSITINYTLSGSSYINGKYYIFGLGGVILMSTDLITWESKSIPDKPLWEIGYLFEIGTKLFAFGSYANTLKGIYPPLLFISTDGGLTWIKKDLNIFDRQAWFAYNKAENSLYMMTNINTHKWSHTTESFTLLTNLCTMSMAFAPGITAAFLNAATDNLLISKDNMLTWEVKSYGPTIGVIDSVYDPNKDCFVTLLSYQIGIHPIQRN